MKLGVDFVDINMIQIFKDSKIDWVDGMTPMMEARAVKNVDEQECMRMVGAIAPFVWRRSLDFGVIDEVRAVAVTSATASQMIGLREIRELLAGKKSLPQCIAEIQQATRRYAKRQLTWFRRQSNFLPLNLSFLTHNEAVKWISLRILSEARTRDD